MYLASGEVFGRLCSFVLIAYVGRVLGIESLGIVSLAQTIYQYGMAGTDMGARLIGARLVAKNFNLTKYAIKTVEKKRILLSLLLFTCICLHAIFGLVPNGSRKFVILYSSTLIPYALTIDWIFWGSGKFLLLGLWRAGVGLSFLVFALLGIQFLNMGVYSVAIGNLISLILGSVTLWVLWIKKIKPKLEITNIEVVSTIKREAGWGNILILGIATIMNQMFQNLDTLLLGAWSEVKEVGIYNAAYKILFLTFGGFYLLTQSAYPTLAKVENLQKAGKIIFKYAILSGFIGVIFIIIFQRFSNEILSLVYGKNITDGKVLRILSLCIPLEFCIALMGTVLTSLGKNRSLLFITGVSAIFNLFLNSYMIPKYGAVGAAWTTIASYVLLFLIILQLFFFPNLTFRRQKFSNSC